VNRSEFLKGNFGILFPLLNLFETSSDLGPTLIMHFNERVIKKLFLAAIVVCFFPFSFPVTSAAESVLDCRKWTEAPEWFKVGYVQGWTAAGHKANETLRNILTTITFEAVKSHIKSTLPEELIKTSLEDSDHEFPNIVVSQIIGGIAKVCADPRVQSWSIYSVMPLVKGRLKEGWTERDLDEVIAYHVKTRNFAEKIERISNASEKMKLLEEWMSLDRPKAIRR
jgi:hypothetical protein